MKTIDLNVASYIDHTILKPDTTSRQVELLCAQAIKYEFASVCIPPAFVSLTSELLQGTSVSVGSVVGFPLGYQCPKSKFKEARLLLSNGAGEIDMVIHVGKLKENQISHVLNEIKEISRICHEQSAILKVIIETALLSNEEKILMCNIVCDANADYIKTSTGFASAGATVEDVRLLYKHVSPNHVKVKAAGGIRSFSFAKELIEAGASRIGTSSGIDIVMGSGEGV